MAKRTDRGRVVETIEPIGIDSQPRCKKRRAVPEPVEQALAVVGSTRRPTKSPSKRARVAKGTPTTDPNKRTIGQRIAALREEAKILGSTSRNPTRTSRMRTRRTGRPTRRWPLA